NLAVVQRRLGKDRRELPTWSLKDQLVDVILNGSDDVVVIVGETGSGKTTQIPQFLLDADHTLNIACTQPRRVAAQTVAARVAAERGCPVGGEIGYSVRFDSKVDLYVPEEVEGEGEGEGEEQWQEEQGAGDTDMAQSGKGYWGRADGEREYGHVMLDEEPAPAPAEEEWHGNNGYEGQEEEEEDAPIDWGRTRLTYMTDGMLLREAIADPCINKYDIIFLDEAHERTVNTDVALGLLRRLLTGTQRTRPLRIVIMSATLEASPIAAFFNTNSVILIKGRQFPVSHHFVSQPEEDYCDAMVNTILTLHVENPYTLTPERPNGDVILGFLSGQSEIENVHHSLKQRMKNAPKGTQPLEIVPLYAQLSAEEQMRAFSTPGKGRKGKKGAEVEEGEGEHRRRVVLATNIAETSLTIPGVRFVVDTGVVKQRFFNPSTLSETLEVD
ncbi:hypothetical protein KIPB_006618, partial [Kipferlia bialata]